MNVFTHICEAALAEEYISKGVHEESEASEDFVVITRRHTMSDQGDAEKTSKENYQTQNDNSHSKSSKWMIQKLELSAKTDLETVIKKIDTPKPYSRVSEEERDEIILDGFSNPGEGGLGKDRTVRKILQLQNMIAEVKKMNTNGKIIVDFCAGGGHLGLAAAKICSGATIVLVETKEESLERARTRIKRWNVTNVVLLLSNLTHLNSKFHIGLALHACGSASDQVIDMCLKWNASFVVSPCCYGRVSDLKLPRSEAYRKIISSQESLLLAHAADITPLEEKLTKKGKECMNLTDTDRKLMCEERGYSALVYEMVPTSCSPKNNFIVASSHS